ncbi:MAG TPA: TonB-dependent receptor, partial [Bacteroidia bacterium]|nr:TonB-dependent receptor [Bacteroidia bacterium]
AHKTDATIFAKLDMQVSEATSIFVDLQYRNVGYKFTGVDSAGNPLPQSVQLNFFNPKAGFAWKISAVNTAYISFSTGNKEPNRDDYTQSTALSRPKPETMYDIETGWKYSSNHLQLTANYFYMYYINQLVLTGKVNDVGAYTRENVSQSYRTGIELCGDWKISDRFAFSANATFSQNKILNYNEYIDNYDSARQDVVFHASPDIAFSPRVTAFAGLTFTGKKGLEISLMEKYVSKQYLDNTSDEAAKLDPYAVTNMTVSYTFHPRGVKELRLGVQLNNLTNAMYSSNGYTYGYVYGGTYNRFNYYYPQAGFNTMGMISLKF